MSAKREVTTRGIVIGRTQAGEGSLRAHLYTEELGLVSAIAKSAREERSKLRAYLTTGTCGMYSLVRGREYWRVTGAVGAVHSLMRRDPEEQGASARVIGVVRQLVHGEGANAALFAAFWEFLHNTNPLVAEHRAVAHILASLGYVAASDLDEPNLIEVINRGLAASGLVS